MFTSLMIVVILIAIGCFVTYGTFCIREKNKADKVVESIIQLEIDFDTLKHTEARIRNEMGIYAASVSKANYSVYTKMLSDVNEEMRKNVKERSKLLFDISNLRSSGKSSRMLYRIERCVAREHADDLRCNAVSTYVRKMAARPRSSFQGLKALGAEIKLLDRETT
jgi:hypothetical protein